MNKQNISDLRINYSLNELIEKNVSYNPINQFEKWFQEALESKVLEPNAMVLSTVSDNKPHSRVVLMKGFSENGIEFYTNYNSNKGKEISKNPLACITFFWAELEKQVRIEGELIKLSEEASTEYYHSRPTNSQIGAWVSNQSEVIEGRDTLDEMWKFYSEKFKNLQKIPRPPHWGGYILKPCYFEFWQGRSSRLHDRIVYEKESENWKIKRLSP
ncbi:MAG: pyridoxamine 5'-phosphate oxidase [Leadbetterella sp.]